MEKVAGAGTLVDAATHAFMVPQTQLRSGDQMETWLRSDAASTVLDAIMTLSAAVQGVKIGDAYPRSEFVRRVVAMLDTLALWIDEIPPLQDHKQRYGNKAFRTWYARLVQEAPTLMTDVLPATHQRAAIELVGYFTSAFGNEVRIDYGTGHELAFVAWMCCLLLIGVVGADDHRALVLTVFAKYLDVARKLQRVYGLEPAGSHGVWGLDDYQFMPFLWGSAQLIDHPLFKPKSAAAKDTAEALAKDYLYMGAITFIFQLKRGPFHEHSPILYDITAVPTWAKVNSGLHKMYVAEVFKKFPIVQHFPFGSLLRLTPSSNPNPLLVQPQ